MKNIRKDFEPLFSALWIPLALGLLMVAVHIGAVYTGTNLSYLGIFPKDLGSLSGIITTPFIHSSYDHLTSNFFPFVLLMWGIVYFYREIALKSVLIMWLATGFWVWLIARPSMHIGASGLVYAFAFFLFFSGMFRKSKQAMTVALTVAMFYGSMVWGIFPAPDELKISWESHLSGTVAGIVCAFAFRKQGPPPEQPRFIDDEHEVADTPQIWEYKDEELPEGFKY